MSRVIDMDTSPTTSNPLSHLIPDTLHIKHVAFNLPANKGAKLFDKIGVFVLACLDDIANAVPYRIVTNSVVLKGPSQIIVDVIHGHSMSNAVSFKDQDVILVPYVHVHSFSAHIQENEKSRYRNVANRL